MRRIAARYIQWRQSQELIVLLAVLATVMGTLLFIALADAVRAGGTQGIDERIILALRDPADPGQPIGPPWAAEVGRDLTALGGVAVLVLVITGVAGYLILHKAYGVLVLVLAATGGGLALSSLFKAIFHRPRPQIVPHLSQVYTTSFPSGHSLLSAVTYLTLGALLARLTPRWRLKVYFMSVAVVLTGLVGISRVYMGVHYPTDVLAGWAAGAVWAIICWLVARQLQRRGQVPTEVATDEID